MQYKITSFNEAVGQIVVEYSDNGTHIATFAMDLPIVDGQFISGQDLADELNRRSPTYIAERRTQLATVSNAADIASLVTATDTTVVTPTLESVKAAKLAQIADWRYRQEVSGIDVNGMLVLTDRETQAQLTGAYVSLTQGLVQNVNWKVNSTTWITLTLLEIAAMAEAVSNHVQRCFTAEYMLTQQVQAATTIEQVQNISLVNVTVNSVIDTVVV